MKELVEIILGVVIGFLIGGLIILTLMNLGWIPLIPVRI